MQERSVADRSFPDQNNASLVITRDRFGFLRGALVTTGADQLDRSSHCGAGQEVYGKGNGEEQSYRPTDYCDDDERSTEENEEDRPVVHVLTLAGERRRSTSALGPWLFVEVGHAGSLWIC